VVKPFHKLLILLALVAKLSNASLMGGGSVTLCYPDIAKLELSGFEFNERTFISHKFGANAGLARVGVFYARFIPVTNSASTFSIGSIKATTNYVWQDFSRYQIDEIYKGLALEYVHVYYSEHVFFPLKAAVGIENKFMSANGVIINFELGFGI
jgi:hypothetical protein